MYMAVPDGLHLDEKVCRSLVANYSMCHPRPFSGEVGVCEAERIAANSRMSLSPAGDTPTTERLINAFRLLTPTAVLHDQMDWVVRAMPFKSIVPWRKLLIPLHYNKSAPITSLAQSARAVSFERLRAVIQLMRKHRRDVLWHINGSVAHLHVLREAQSTAEQAITSAL